MSTYISKSISTVPGRCSCYGGRCVDGDILYVSLLLEMPNAAAIFWGEDLTQIHNIGLPEMDGNELARRLRALPETSQITLVAVSGYGQEGDRQRSLGAGFDHYLVKPVNSDRLAEILEDLTTSSEDHPGKPQLIIAR